MSPSPCMIRADELRAAGAYGRSSVTMPEGAKMAAWMLRECLPGDYRDAYFECPRVVPLAINQEKSLLSVHGLAERFKKTIAAEATPNTVGGSRWVLEVLPTGMGLVGREGIKDAGRAPGRSFPRRVAMDNRLYPIS